MTPITPDIVNKALETSERTQYRTLLSLLGEGKILNAHQQKKYDAYQAKIKLYLASLEEASPSSDPSLPDLSANIGIPVSLRVRRRYTMSEAALAQRRAATHSPAKCDAMAGNRNGWKHGHYAENFINKLKPCLSTCPSYPCSLVEGGEVEPGDDCLDKADIISFFRSIHSAVAKKEYDSFNELASLQIANTIKIVEMLQEDVLRDGSVVKRVRYDKDTGKLISEEYVPHPSLLALPKLVADLGLNPAEFLMTPRSLKRADAEEKGITTLAEMMSRAGKPLKSRFKTSESDDTGE
jgi:hypothetical protein